jgi:hypothetical protein
MERRLWVPLSVTNSVDAEGVDASATECGRECCAASRYPSLRPLTLPENRRVVHVFGAAARDSEAAG